MAITVRLAEERDAARMLEFLPQLGGESDNLTFGAEGMAIPLEAERAYLKAVNSEHSVMAVALDGERIIGNCQLVCGRRPRVAHSGEFSIGVLKAYCGCGVASRLFKEVKSWAIDHQIKKINLLVRSDNERAKAFYQKCGFRQEGTCSRMLQFPAGYVDGEYWGLEL